MKAKAKEGRNIYAAPPKPAVEGKRCMACGTAPAADAVFSGRRWVMKCTVCLKRLAISGGGR